MPDLTPKQIAEKIRAEAEDADLLVSQRERLEDLADGVERLAHPAYRAAWVAELTLADHERGCNACDQRRYCGEAAKLYLDWTAAHMTAWRTYQREAGGGK